MWTRVDYDITEITSREFFALQNFSSIGRAASQKEREATSLEERYAAALGFLTKCGFPT